MNLHASALVVGDRGLLVVGPSGSGKTALVLELMARAHLAGCFAALVADDQVLVRPRGDRLVVAAPPAIRGLVEVRGATPAPVASLDRTVVDLLVRLVPRASAPRYAEPATEALAGVDLAVLHVEERNVTAAVPTVQYALAVPRFGIFRI